MKTWALVVDTWREALARYTLLGFLIASSLYLLTLAFALNLDIVDGTLAAASLFGKSLDLDHGALAIGEVVQGVEAAFTGMAYGLGLFLAVFTTGSQVPNLVKRGTVDLYLSRPLSRTHALLGRFAGAVTLVAANILLLCGGTFLIVSLKTGVWNPRFLAAGGLIFVAFLAFLGLMVLVGVLSGSTPLSIMIPYAIYVISMPLVAHDKIAAAMDSRLAATVVQWLYWVLPKSAEMGRDMVRLVMGEAAPSAMATLTTLGFGAACLALAVVLFNRKNY